MLLSNPCPSVSSALVSALSFSELNCCHFVAILGDKGCYVK